MPPVQYFVGIDVSAETFAASIFTGIDQSCITTDQWKNDLDHFPEWLMWLQEHNVTKSNAVIVMESTGAYSEKLVYFLQTQGFSVAVEQPLKVKRAFNPSSEKTDPVDSQQIAEYGYRFHDELNFFQPSEELIEEVKTLLSTRELFTTQLTANTNARKVLDKKHYPIREAKRFHDFTISHLKEQIKEIDRKINNIIKQNPQYRQMISSLTSVPGVGLLLAANLLVLTDGFTHHVSARKISSYAHICPRRYQSGSSVYRRPQCPKYGPPVLRKLLYLAALSVRTHNQQFKTYFLRKVAEGKPKRLVLNNIANKLLKIICAVLVSNKRFIPNYHSINPLMLKTA